MRCARFFPIPRTFGYDSTPRTSTAQIDVAAPATSIKRVAEYISGPKNTKLIVVANHRNKKRNSRSTLAQHLVENAAHAFKFEGTKVLTTVNRFHPRISCEFIQIYKHGSFARVCRLHNNDGIFLDNKYRICFKFIPCERHFTPATFRLLFASFYLHKAILDKFQLLNCACVQCHFLQ